MIKTFSNNIYIVMYHYVREIKKSKYPNLKGLEFDEFKNQILYFKKNFNILNNEQFCEIINTKVVPKKKSVLLSFDDGYQDHFNYVFPYLKKKKLSGFFYPSVDTILHSKVLDVNKIQFILEKENDKKKIINFIFNYLKKNKIKIKNLKNLSLKSRWDDKETVLIKRLLQYFLPKKIRDKIINKLFIDLININEKEFSKNLYLTKGQIIEMSNNSMTIGSHGSAHNWLANMTINNQEKDIKKSLKFFKEINLYNENFSFCYPHGSFNKYTIKILKKLKIKFALSTLKGSVNNKNISNRFYLSRLDTNDFRL